MNIAATQTQLSPRVPPQRNPALRKAEIWAEHAYTECINTFQRAKRLPPESLKKILSNFCYHSGNDEGVLPQFEVSLSGVVTFKDDNLDEWASRIACDLTCGYSGLRAGQMAEILVLAAAPFRGKGFDECVAPTMDWYISHAFAKAGRDDGCSVAELNEDPPFI